eukprot:scaffold657033_cov42-Prasinocladus_malaysianus.AAC.1
MGCAIGSKGWRSASSSRGHLAVDGLASTAASLACGGGTHSPGGGGPADPIAGAVARQDRHRLPGPRGDAPGPDLHCTDPRLCGQQ